MRSYHLALRVFALLLFSAGILLAAGSLDGQRSGNGSVDPWLGMMKNTWQQAKYLPDRIIIKVKQRSGMGKQWATVSSSLLRALEKYSPQSVAQRFPVLETPATGNSVDLNAFYVLRYTAPMDPIAMAEEVSALEDVEYAEPWFVYEVNEVAACAPNDPDFNTYQWGMRKIQADSAWCQSTGDPSVVIGIIDTGVQTTHPDLTANIWQNPGETGTDGNNNDKRTNGVDDDGNGMIDDFQGWDFGGADYNNPTEDNIPSPTKPSHGHGTHVAGIAGAVTNNGVGVAGVGYRSKIMPVKVSSDNDLRGSGSSPLIVFFLEGILYAARNGADVINCSFGGAGASLVEEEIVNYVTGLGALVVAASGNSNSAVANYPAAYDNVLSAAYTNQNDVKGNSTNYGTTVEIAAPGEAIRSTYYSNSYQNLAGSSMASPHVAGAVALVKALHPEYTPRQLGEQVRVTADDIDAILSNANFKKKLGKGRLNVRRALAETSPAIRIQSFDVDDAAGNNNGYGDAGETIVLHSTFINYLAPTSGAARATIVSVDTNFQVLDSIFTIGTMPTLTTASTTTTPFRVRIGANAPLNYLASLRIDFSDGAYQDYQYVTLLLNARFQTHLANNVVFSLSNFGSFGYNDYANGSIQYGEGFQFPPNSGSALYHGALMIGTDSLHTIDNVYGNPNNTTAVDFKTAYNGNFTSLNERMADQVLRCAFTDSGAAVANQLGLLVTQRSYAYSAPPDNDYVTLRFDVQNTTGTTISNAYIGVYADWDIITSDNDHVSYDAARRLGYMWDALGSNYYGVGLVFPTAAASARAVNNATYIYNGFWESNKFRFLSEGFALTSSSAVGDWSSIVSAGPFTINAGATVTAAFAFIGGESLADIQANADAANAKWAIISDVAEDAPPAGIPAAFALKQNYPNPFNPVTNISYDVPVSSLVTLKVFNVLGQEVATLVQGDLAPGRHTVPFDASNLGSGMYFYRLTAGNFTETRKMTILK